MNSHQLLSRLRDQDSSIYIYTFTATFTKRVSLTLIKFHQLSYSLIKFYQLYSYRVPESKLTGFSLHALQRTANSILF